ncbi:hypothetical protein LTS10_004623 [Elasticomyces elasticus]|nr:hypothetical protein LTS10_004623 [Elasticomyces elasticus]
MEAFPQELIDHIGGECDKASVLSLRLANKKLAAALRSTFVERYISKRIHLYSIYGLQKLLDLTADKDLAKHINEIVLVVQSRHLDYNPDHTLTEGYEYQLCQSETAWLDIEEYGGSRATHLIRSVLWNLKDAASSVTFGFSESYRSSHPYGLGIRQQQAGIAGLVRPNVEPDDRTEVNCEGIVKALLKASEGWSGPISQLNICHDLQDPSFASFPCPFEGFKPPLAKPAWSMLRSLKLYTGYGIRSWNKTSCWQGLDRFVTAVPNLEHVALAWESLIIGSELNEILEGMGNVFGRIHVKHIELGSFCTTRRALIKFLCSQMRSLESVKLVGVALRSGKGWRRVLKAVAEQTTVGKIELDRVWAGELIDWQKKYYMVMDEQGSHRLVQEGSQAVKKRLIELASKATFTDETGAKLNLADSRTTTNTLLNNNAKSLRTVVNDSSMDQLHTLGEMPPELKIIMGECCDRTSLLHLRLVNRDFDAAVRPIFIDRYIKRRVHLYTPFGLKKLVELTANEELAKHIKEVEVVPEYPHPTLMRANNMGRSRLRQALVNLDNSKSVVAFSTMRTRRDDHPYGRGAVQSKFDDPDFLDIKYYKTVREAHYQDVLKSLMEASATVDVPIWQLNIGYKRRGVGSLRDEKASWLFDGNLISPGQLAWHNLKSLRIDFGIDALEWEEAVWLKFDNFILDAPNLESVALCRLVQYEAGWIDVVRRLGLSLQSCSLKIFTLQDCLGVTEEALIGFLIGQKHSLQEVRFVDLTLHTGSLWEHVLESVATELGLVMFELSGPTVGYGNGRKKLWVGEAELPDVLYHGAEMVRRELIALTRSVSYRLVVNSDESSSGSDDEDGDE